MPKRPAFTQEKGKEMRPLWKTEMTEETNSPVIQKKRYGKQ